MPFSTGFSQTLENKILSKPTYNVAKVSSIKPQTRTPLQHEHTKPTPKQQHLWAQQMRGQALASQCKQKHQNWVTQRLAKELKEHVKNMYVEGLWRFPFGHVEKEQETWQYQKKKGT